MPKIDMSLSVSSIGEAIKKLEAYSDSIKTNTEKLCKAVVDELEEKVSTGFNGAEYDFIVQEKNMLADGIPSVPNVSVTQEVTGTKGKVSAEGEEAYFVEFGAGVYFNPGGAPHPARGGNVVAIGEYGYGLGKMKVWRFTDKNGQTVMTHGTPASMPMYLSAQEIADEIPDIARGVFQSGG